MVMPMALTPASTMLHSGFKLPTEFLDGKHDSHVSPWCDFNGASRTKSGSDFEAAGNRARPSHKMARGPFFTLPPFWSEKGQNSKIWKNTIFLIFRDFFKNLEIFHFVARDIMKHFSMFCNRVA